MGIVNPTTQHENEKAVQKIKEVQAEAKEKARIMAEENAKLASQLIQCQRRGMASGPQAATELSLQDALDRETQLQKLEVQLKKEVGRLKDELIKVCINSNSLGIVAFVGVPLSSSIVSSIVLKLGAS